MVFVRGRWSKYDFSLRGDLLMSERYGCLSYMVASTHLNDTAPPKRRRLRTLWQSSQLSPLSIIELIGIQGSFFKRSRVLLRPRAFRTYCGGVIPFSLSCARCELRFDSGLCYMSGRHLTLVVTVTSRKHIISWLFAGNIKRSETRALNRRSLRILEQICSGLSMFRLTWADGWCFRTLSES